MTAWSPGNEDLDVLSLGDPGTSRPAPGRAVAGLVLLCLGVGLLLGAHFSGDTAVTPKPRAADPVGPVRCAEGRPDRERADCPPGRPALASDLTGTWLRTGVHGVWRGLQGRELMRFDADGGFTWGLVGPYRAVRGRYRLSGGTVTVTAMRMSLCHAGDTYTWRATLTRTGRLHLADVAETERAGCRVSPEVWSGRPLQDNLVRAFDHVRGSARASRRHQAVVRGAWRGVAPTGCLTSDWPSEARPEAAHCDSPPGVSGRRP